MLDSPEDICAGQARFEYPATFVLFSKCSPDALQAPLMPCRSFTTPAARHPSSLPSSSTSTFHHPTSALCYTFISTPYRPDSAHLTFP
jgi:hypothetical protein